MRFVLDLIKSTTVTQKRVFTNPFLRLEGVRPQPKTKFARHVETDSNANVSANKVGRAHCDQEKVPQKE
jgi:hypothetical protein